MKSLDFVTINAEAGSATLVVDTGVYSLDRIKRAAFCFVEFCYLYLEPTDDAHIAVTMTPKLPGPSEELLEEFLGEFANELLNQLLRDQLQKDTQNARELIVGRALYAASGEAETAADELVEVAFDATDGSDHVRLLGRPPRRDGGRDDGCDVGRTEEPR